MITLDDPQLGDVLIRSLIDFSVDPWLESTSAVTIGGGWRGNVAEFDPTVQLGPYSTPSFDSAALRVMLVTGEWLTIPLDMDIMTVPADYIEIAVGES